MVSSFACTSSTIRVSKLAGADGYWHRWATSSILDWQPDPDFNGCPVLQIHGSADTTFPIRYISPDVTVVGGRHALAVSNPMETVEAILAFIGKLDQRSS